MHPSSLQKKEAVEIEISFLNYSSNPIIALIDSGSSDCFLTKQFANSLKIPTKEMKEKRRLILFDQRKSNVIISEYAIVKTFFTASRSFNICYLILPAKADHHVVLGRNFLQGTQAVINFGSSIMSFPEKSASKNILGETHQIDTSESQNQNQTSKNKKENLQNVDVSIIHAIESSNHDEKDTINNIPKEYQSFSDVFSKKSADILPPHRPYDHKITIEENSKLPFGPIYSLSPTEMKALRGYLDEMLSKGFIRASSSPAGSPVLFVKKKDGSLRLCVDYRRLNAITKKNVYPLPLINNLLDQLSSSKIFTKIDLRGAYNLVRIAEGDEYKTAFRTRYGSFEYLVMPFGLCNAPATFQHFMNDAFHDMLDLFVIIYLDDILIFSKNLEDHQQHVTSVLERLRTHNLFAKLEKCIFHASEVEFLGYRINGNGISMDENKVKAILSWSTPKNVKELQSFLGFSNFYRRFILGYSTITRPLHDLTKKNASFIWSTSCENAFKVLKTAFTTAPVLVHYDFKRKTVIESDASDIAIASILSQYDELNQLHPVAYFSRSLNAAERNYEVHDKELLAICESFREWRAHLQGVEHQIIVITDHKSLEYFTTTKKLTRRQARWSEFLSEFDFVIKYRPGKLGIKADALSRKSNNENDFQKEKENLQILLPKERFVKLAATFSINQNEQNIISEIKKLLQNDPVASAIITELKTIESRKKNDYELTPDDILLYKSRIYVPNDDSVKIKILKMKHDHITSGHPGRKKTLHIMRRDFFFPKMNDYVNRYVQSCFTCCRNKASRHKSFGLLQSLPISSRPWSSITMDFIEPLPLSVGHDSILVVVDRLTKMSIFIPCTTTATSKDLANLFIQHVVSKHGLPFSIVSDRGTKFTSSFWSSVCESLSIQQHLSTSYHPQTDGQSERVNQSLEQYLRMYVNYDQSNWCHLLPVAEFVYNSMPHSSINVSPFFANYGYQPVLEIDVLVTRHDQAKIYAKDLQALHQYLKEEIKKSNESSARYYNKKRIPAPEYKLNDQVWLSTENLHLSRPMKKLSEKFIGPFKIIEIISPNAVKLQLPSHLRGIHPVFNVSLLQPFKENNIPNRFQPPPPPVEVEGEIEYEVEDILDYRVRNNQEQYLVKWLGYEGDEERVTWEPLSHVEHLTDLLRKVHEKKPRKQPITARKRELRKRN